MEISPYMLFLLLVYSFVFGMAAGVFNDINRIIRALLGDCRRDAQSCKLYNTKVFLVGKMSDRRESRILPVIIFFQDVMLFVFIGCGIVILNYYLNRGQMRIYTVTAVIGGFVLYYFTLGKLVTYLSNYIVFFARAFFAIAFKIAAFPFRAFLGVIKKIFLFALEKIKFLLEKRRLVRYNKRKGLEEQGTVNNGEKEGVENEI